MKKYIKPAVMIVNVANEQILAGSFSEANDSTGHGTTGGFAKESTWSDED